MLKKPLALIAWVLITPLAFGQQPERDSLLQQLKSAKEDTAAVHLYLAIGKLYEGPEGRIANEYYAKAATLSNKLNYPPGSIAAYIRYSNYFFMTGDYDSIIFYNEKTLAIARSIKDTFHIGASLFNMGTAYSYLADYEKATEYCLEGRKMIEGRAQPAMEQRMNDMLQVLYNELIQYDKAIAFGEKAVQQARELKMPDLLAQALTNLSNSYLQKDMNKQARQVLMEALPIAKELGNIQYEATIVINLSDIYMESGEYEIAKGYIERSLLLYRQLEALDGEVIALRAMARYYLNTKDFINAKKMGEQALHIAAKNNFRRQHVLATNEMANVYYATGDMRNGDKLYRASFDTLKVMVEDLVSERSANLEKKYETEKKETQIKQLQAEKKVQELSIRQQDILNAFLIGGIIAVLAISILLYRNYKSKQKLQQQRITELETEKQLTATEAVLKGEEQERTRLAKELHDGLGGMLSGIKYSFQTMKGNLVMTHDNQQAFERSMDMLDSSIKEMRRVAHNMMPEALVKFGLDIALKDFCHDINQSGALQVNYQSIGLENVAIEQTTAITIYRIVQELINNTMKHAAAKIAIVQVSKTANVISVTVEDDGRGFNTAILEGTGGIGWSNIKSRVSYLNGKIDVQSSLDKGTSVHIELNA